jgi:hypothetical protein
MVKLNKSGQAGNGAAILLIVITVLIVLFILFLPPAERYNLLSNNSNVPGTTASSAGVILLRETPLRLNYISDDEREYDLSSFTISTSVSGQVLTSRSSLYVKNSAFEKRAASLQFTATSGLTENILLSFNVVDAEGRLNIALNGETIFDSEIQAGNSPPITLDAEKIQESNELIFSVSGPGVAFWRYNEYTLQNVKITADVTDNSQSENTQTLLLTEQDLAYLKDARLRYNPVCSNQGSRLDVSVNGMNVFSGVPDCGMYAYKPISSNLLFAGENKFVFRVNSGTILIDGIRLTSTFETDNNPIYYFEMEDANFTNPADPEDFALKSNYDVFMDLTFPNTDAKRFEIFINGKKIGFNTAKKLETRQIDNYVRPGTNSVEIRPLQDMTLTELKIRLKRI